MNRIKNEVMASSTSTKASSNSSIESNVANNKVKRFLVKSNGNRFLIDESNSSATNNARIVKENERWICVVEGDPDNPCPTAPNTRILIPFANLDTWRSDVVKRYPSVDCGRISLIGVRITEDSFEVEGCNEPILARLFIYEFIENFESHTDVD